MKLQNTYSSQKDVIAAVNEISEGLSEINPSTILYFASSEYDQKLLSEKIQEKFKDANIFGCSTSGEITSGKMLKKSIVAMGYDSEMIEDVQICVLENISSKITVEEAFQSFEEHFGQSMEQLDINQHVGIILIDGLRAVEEKIMDRIGDLTNVTFIGASAGDDLKFKETYVYANGRAYTDAAVLALLKPGCEFDFLKTQSFEITDKKITATKVDEAAREVIEFNSKPAIEAYAEAIEQPVEKAGDFFMHNPVGLIVDNKPYVRSPQQVKGKNICFYCNILQGMEVSVLESTNIIEDTQDAIEDKINELGNIKGIINFHCILRTLELEQKNQTEEYGKIFADIPTIGFSTYGEEYIGHINQTSMMLMFK